MFVVADLLGDDVEALAPEPLRPDVTLDEATDTLWVLASFDSFDALYTGRGLAADQVARVLITTAERTLCR